MEKSLSHQIDDLAKRVFHDALPTTWVPNEFFKDYAKDFHVEIGDDNGKLTGTSILVQLKGQKQVEYNKQKTCVKFSLQTKHAQYYLDKQLELPVFLVVVDVTEKRGWYVHVQPILDRDQSWRKKKSGTIKLPIEHDLSNQDEFRKAIIEAHRQMRLLHPTPIIEAMRAETDRIKRLDPRFGVSLSMSDDNRPHFHLKAREPVGFQVENITNDKDIQAKIDELFDLGNKVSFQPGQIRITGSKLFEEIAKSEVELQQRLIIPATLSFVCKDFESVEVGRLDEIPGRFEGGRKELTFTGGLQNSPVVLSLGPIQHSGILGPTHFTFSIHNWNGQALRVLAYFDRIFSFIRQVQKSATTEVTARVNGNVVLSAESDEFKHADLDKLVYYLDLIDKARRLCERFGINPIWDATKFNHDEVNTVLELYGVFFEGESRRESPHFRMTTTFVGNTFRHDLVEYDKPAHLKLVGPSTYMLLGERMDAGRMAYELTEAMMLRPSSKRRHRPRRIVGTPRDKVPVTFGGTSKSTILARLARDDD